VYHSSSHPIQTANARAAGLLVDHYWFNGRDASFAEQARVIANAGIKDGELLWWDVESEGTKPHWTPGEVATAATALEAAGIPVTRQGIYLSSAVTRAANWLPVVDLGLPLWVADYGQNNGVISSEPLANYWKDVVLWQYTSTAKLPGYAGNLDMNTTRDVWTVFKLQVALNRVIDAGLVEDGQDGTNTRNAVRKYQESRGLAVDGIAGRDTLTRLAADFGGIPEVKSG
jgi:GH25 family lysozyme M1 (1,4-beta-N-acetylmuramidase)